MPKIAVSIVGPTEDDALRDIDQAVEEGADLIEVRRDCFDELDLARVHKHIRDQRKRTIFTCRHKAEAGPGKGAGFQGNERRRKELYLEANSLGVNYVDIEHAFPLFDHFGEIKCRNGYLHVISSAHNWEETPSHKMLYKLANDMRMTRPDVIKIATMTRSPEDCTDILRLLDDFHLGDFGEVNFGNVKGLAMGMGPLCGETRVYGPMHGAEWVYACVGDKRAAPGQFSVRDLRSIWKTLGIEG